MDGSHTGRCSEGRCSQENVLTGKMLKREGAEMGTCSDGNVLLHGGRCSRGMNSQGKVLRRKVLTDELLTRKVLTRKILRQMGLTEDGAHRESPHWETCSLVSKFT